MTGLEVDGAARASGAGGSGWGGAWRSRAGRSRSGRRIRGWRRRISGRRRAGALVAGILQATSVTPFVDLGALESRAAVGPLVGTIGPLFEAGRG